MVNWNQSQRKIGHINLVDKDDLGMDQLLERVNIVSNSIKIIPE